MVFERFLPDWRRSMEQAAINGWVRGDLSLNGEQEARGHLLAIHFLESLTIESLQQFYSVEPKKEVKKP